MRSDLVQTLIRRGQHYTKRRAGKPLPCALTVYPPHALSLPCALTVYPPYALSLPCALTVHPPYALSLRAHARCRSVGVRSLTIFCPTALTKKNSTMGRSWVALAA